MYTRTTLAVLAFVVCILPGSAMGLTGGPLQPEYQSFEPVDVTDLVNLPTGDFTYTIGLGEVRGPAGVGYPIVLSYHAGIRSEQEAQWTGLGWSVNVGAINRQIVGIPDDLPKSTYSSYLYDPGDQGYECNLSLGVSVKAVSVGFDLGWNNKGFQGVTGVNLGYKGLSLGYNWERESVSMGMSVGGIGMGATVSEHGSSVGVSMSRNGVSARIGIGFGQDMAPSFNAGISLHNGFAGMSLASVSLSSAGVRGGPGFFGQSRGAFTEGGSHFNSSSWFISLSAFWFSVSFDYYEWRTYYRQFQVENSYGYLYTSPEMDPTVWVYDPLIYELLEPLKGYQSYWDYEYVNSVDLSGFLGKGGSVNDPTEDPFSDIVDNGDKIDYQPFPTGQKGAAVLFAMPSQDVYNITGQGIAGAFKPYFRQSMRVLRSTDESQNGNMFKGSGTDNPWNDAEYSVGPFLKNGLVFKMVSEAALNLIDKPGLSLSGYNEPYSSIVRHTNNETGVVETGAVGGTQIIPLFGTATQAHKLDGFIVIDQQGKRYFYTQPLRTLQFVTLTNEKAEYPSDWRNAGSQFSCNISNEPYATTWLLTAITGPDYVRMNSSAYDPPDDAADNGYVADPGEQILPQQGDYGYWVRFRYAYDKDTPVATYLWQNPYKDFARPPNKDDYSVAFGQKEITYLKSIETPCEVAYFRTSEREDGMGLTRDEYPNNLPSGARAVITQQEVISLKDFFDRYSNQITGSVLPASYDDPRMLISARVELYGAQYTNTWYAGIEEDDPVLTLNFGGDGRCWACDGSAWYCWNAREGDISAAIRVYKDADASGHGISGSHEYAVTLRNGQQILLNDAKMHVVEYARINGAYWDSDKQCFVLSIVGYRQRKGNSYIATGVRIRRNFDNDCRQCCSYNIDMGRSYASVEQTTYIRPDNPVVTRLRKLDKIAWYSRAKYPYLHAGTDPADVDDAWYVDKGHEVPSAYHKVAFGYDYSLAPGTPNSSATCAGKGDKGRLALRSVSTEGHDGATAVLPPYLFDYQNDQTPYPGVNNWDPWGFGKGELGDPQRGVHWNLSRIVLPSGAELEVQYERDRLEDHYWGIVKLAENDEEWDNVEPQFGHDYLTRIQGGVVEKAPIAEGYIGGDPTVIKFDRWHEDELAPIEVGDFVYFYSKDGGGGDNSMNQDECNFLYRVVAIDLEECTIRIDAPLEFRAAWFGQSTKLTVGVNGLFVKRNPTYGGDIRVRSLESRSLDHKSYCQEYHYPSAGHVDILPSLAIPRMMQEAHVTSAHGYDIVLHDIDNDLVSGNYRYTVGNEGVIYPEVTVAKAAQGGSLRPDSVRYSFFTWRSKVPVEAVGGGAPTVEHVRQKCTYQSQVVDVYRVMDRSAIVGSITGVEYFGENGRVVKSVGNTYAFSEDMENRGVFFGTLDNNISSNSVDEPLGLIQERCLSMNASQQPIAMTDVSISKPFLVSTTMRVDRVPTTTNYYFYDARTGSPMATVTTNTETDNTVRRRMDLSVPYAYALKAGSDPHYAHLARRNMFQLGGGSVTLDATGLLASESAVTTMTAATLFSASNILAGSADLRTLRKYDVTNMPFEQGRFELTSALVLESPSGFTLPCPGTVGAGWLTRTTVDEVDRYSRPLTEYGAVADTNTAFYHPLLEGAVAVVRNAENHECAAYTCDYDEGSGTGSLDVANEWGRGLAAGGSVMLDRQTTHYGAASIHVQNSFGPSKNISIDKTRDYLVSAWVRLTNSTGRLAIEFRAGDNVQIGSWDVDLAGRPTGSWMRVQREIRMADVPKHLQAGKTLADVSYIRIWVGNAIGQPACNLHVDDIRVHPMNALMKTYYYDPELGVPVAFVDENSKSRTYGYDAFGRLTQVYNAAGQKTEEYEYHMSCQDGLVEVRLLHPNSVSHIESQRPTTVRWSAPCAVDERVLLKMDGQLIEGCPSQGILARSGSFVWTPANPAVNKRLRIEVKGTDIFDESDVPFDIGRRCAVIMDPAHVDAFQLYGQSELRFANDEPWPDDGRSALLGLDEDADSIHIVVPCPGRIYEPNVPIGITASLKSAHADLALRLIYRHSHNEGPPEFHVSERKAIVLRNNQWANEEIRFEGAPFGDGPDDETDIYLSVRDVYTSVSVGLDNLVFKQCAEGLTGIELLYPNTSDDDVIEREDAVVRWRAPCAGDERVVIKKVIAGAASLVAGCPANGVPAADHEFVWRPAEEASDVRLRLEVVGSDVFDESDETFEIEHN